MPERFDFQKYSSADIVTKLQDVGIDVAKLMEAIKPKPEEDYGTSTIHWRQLGEDEPKQGVLVLVKRVDPSDASDRTFLDTAPMTLDNGVWNEFIEEHKSCSGDLWAPMDELDEYFNYDD